MIKAHLDDYHAQQFSPTTWQERGIEHKCCWRSCSYCGSMHPEDLLNALKDGAILTGSDWKYGWPHKFYIEVRNPEPERLFVDSSCNFDPEREGYIKEGNSWVKYGTRKTLYEKFYNVHLKDDEVPMELWDVLAEHSRIRFRLEGEDLAYCAPYRGFQAYGDIVSLDGTIKEYNKGTRNTPIPDWPK